MRISWVVLTGLGVVVHGCASPDSTLESAGQPIIAGPPDTGDPAIMELLSFKGNTGSRCTATLITPRVLLAAAHCLVETPGFERYVFPGNDDRNVADKDLLRPMAVVSDPQYTQPRQGHDFSVIVLAAPLPIRPVPINRASLDKAQGKAVRYVGYGLVTVGDPNSGGVKRQNTAPLAQVSGVLLAIASNAHNVCNGDSGGPLLLAGEQGESIVGVGSFVANPACLRESYYQRIDTQLAWVDEQIKKYDPGGFDPPPDAGASDTAAPSPPPDGGLPDAETPVTLPPDAAPADTPPPRTEPARDARASDTASPPRGEPEPAPPDDEPSAASGAGGGCAYAAGTGRTGAGAALLLALAWLGRRRTRGGRAQRRDAK